MTCAASPGPGWLFQKEVVQWQYLTVRRGCAALSGRPTGVPLVQPDNQKEITPMAAVRKGGGLFCERFHSPRPRLN